MESNNAGLVALAVALFLGLFVVGLGIRNGLARSAAMEVGMTSHEYSDWMDDVRR